MLPRDLLIVVSKTTTLVCDGFVASLAYRAYLRTQSPALRALAYGLAFVTLGAFVAGALHQVAGVTIETGVAVQSAFTAVGFLVLAYSLYARTPERDRDRSAAGGDGVSR